MIVAAEVSIVEATHVAEARRVAIRLAQQLDFDETAQGRLAILVTEIATNILKHAGSGRVLLSPVFHETNPALDCYGFDSGPGISNLAACLRDGYSTAGSPGTGLGAIARISDAWDVYTGTQQGTVIRARCCYVPPQPRQAHAGRVDVGGIAVPFKGEAHCGDAWAVRRSEDSFSMLMVDGLGHGYEAALASQAAIEVFRKRPALAGVPLLEELHASLRTTRGAAVAAAEVNPQSGELQFTGIGNIAGVIYDGTDNRHLVSMNGIVGHKLGKVRQFSYPWLQNSVLILHSDGLRNRWSLDNYPGLQSRSPALIAGVLMRDASRGTDDSTVAVASMRGSQHVS